MPNTEPDIPSSDHIVRDQQILQSLEEGNCPQELSDEVREALVSLTERRQSNRARTISSLQGTKLSKRVEKYLTRLREGSLTWDEETFIEGVLETAEFLNFKGTERARHLGHELKGIHHQNRYAASWNQIYPEQPIAWWEPDATRCCPESWSHVIDNGRWKLVHRRTGHFSQGMNEVFLGPTTLDCGMATQFLILMGCRWMFGDPLSDRLFPGLLSFVQSIFNPQVDRLFPFYDNDRFRYDKAAKTPSRRVQLQTVYNDNAYETQHPGGMRLHNCVVVNSFFIVFDPAAPKTLLTRAEMEDLLQQQFNAVRDEADRGQILWYACSPKNRVLAKEIQAHQHLELSGDAWRERRSGRKPDVKYTLRVDRIIQCARETLNTPSTSNESNNMFSRAWQLYHETVESSLRILQVRSQ